MARLLNVLLVGSAVALLVVGAVYLGRAVRDDAASNLTESIPARAAATTAESQLRAAIFAATTYFVRHSTYAGMTAGQLRAEVDSGLAPDISVEDATATAYCIETTVGDRAFSYRVRGGFPTPGSGC